MALRAIVIGAGFAGEGITIALREANVDVIAMCGRTPEPTRATARKLGIDDVRFDWREAITVLKPDIVAITTPAAPHREMAEFAAQCRCHIACEKPLALTADDAKAMLLAVENAGVKHAYAATGCYSPQFATARQLLSQEPIGRIQAIEYIGNADTSPYLPYHWFHQLNQGGGSLFQAFTHLLIQVLRVTGAQVRASTGATQRLIERAPVGPALNEYPRALVTPEQAAIGEWRDVDADTGFIVLAQLEMPQGYSVNALFRAMFRGATQLPNHLTFYGTLGTLQMTGSRFPEHIQLYRHDSQSWQEVAVSEPLVGSLAQTKERNQKQWNQFFLEFVADVRGEGYAGYPTFRDGWIANQVIDSARKGLGMTEIVQETNSLNENP